MRLVFLSLDQQLESVFFQRDRHCLACFFVLDQVCNFYGFHSGLVRRDDFFFERSEHESLVSHSESLSSTNW